MEYQLHILFMEATRIAVSGFEGLFWPGRFVIICIWNNDIYSIMTYMFKGEGVIIKNCSIFNIGFVYYINTVILEVNIFIYKILLGLV